MQTQSQFVSTTSPGYYQVRQLGDGQANQEVSSLVRWAFYSFVFSMLFEAAPIGIEVETTQITSGLLVGALVFLQPRIFLQPLPRALSYLLIYFFVGGVVLFAYGNLFDSDTLPRQFKFLQLLFLFWISVNLMQDERTARGTLISLIASCASLSLLHLLGLTTTTESADSRLARFTAFGLDSNQLSGVLALGVLAAVGFAFEKRVKPVNPIPVILPVIVLIGTLLIRTGSRGGLLAMVSGVLVFSLGRGNFSSKVRNIVVVLLLFGFFALIAYQSELVRHRFEVTLDDGTMSNREHFYPLAVDMILERPLLGWGPVENSVELGQRAQLYYYERLDPHNLILYILTATGIIGAIPFFASLWLCVRSAWRARGGPYGILPFAMTVTLLTSEMSVTGFHWKHHWIVLAYALASSSHLATSKRQRFLFPQTSSVIPRMRLPGLHGEPQTRASKLI